MRVVSRSTLNGERLEPRWVLDSVVVLNELMYHPAAADTRGEWVELRNLLSVDVDLSGWSLRGGVDYDLPDDTVIPADGLLLIVAQPDAWAGNTTTIVLGPWQGALDNAGERIELRNNSDRVMDAVRYDDRDPWPVAADGAGPSLAKLDPYWTSADVANWSASYNLRGTPGLPNAPPSQPAPQLTQVVPLTASWRYRADGVDLGAAWRQPDYVDAAWPAGPALFFGGATQAGPDEVRLLAIDPASDGEIGTDRSYTHVLDFGNADGGADVNGVQFTQATSSTITQIPHLQWSNSSGIRTNGKPADVDPLAGPLADVYQDYVANSLNLADGTAQLVLQDLVPGQRYLTRLFARRADAAARNVTLEFDPGGAPQTIGFDQNAPPIPRIDDPYVVEFEFAATSDQLSITATQHDGTKPWYWYGLTNEVVQLTGNTEVAAGTNTHYFRTSFDYTGDLLADHELQLRLNADDGAVVYLNGNEIHRDNMPPGNVDFATQALVNIDSGQQRPAVTLPATQLRLDGPNVLAVELHQAAGGEADVRFGAELSVIETERPYAAPPQVRLNELPAVGAAARWVELINRDTEPVELNRLTLQWQDSQTSTIPLPDRALAPQETLSVPVPADHGAWSAGDRIVLYMADGSAVVDAQALRDTPQARSWQHAGRWLRPSTQTPGDDNRFALTEDVVINEIMYHGAPRYAQGEQAFAESPEEWIELYNRGATAIDLSGWSLAGGLDYEFAAGTILQPDSYLVVSNDAARLRTLWPSARIVGDFTGRLGDQDDLIVLQDAVGNPADEVHYYDSGRWPLYADGGGSSLELRDPRADNAQGESWAASHQDTTAPWVTISYEGPARNPQSSPDPAEWNELILGLLDAGEVLLDDVSVIEDPAGAAIERMQNGAFENDAAHWRFVGNHGQHGLTQVIVDPDDPGNHVLHVVATGATEHMSNHLETTFLDNARISSGTTYRISFRARWLAGSPQLHSRLYFNRLAATHILPQPAATGTPGQPNSQWVANSGPTFHSLQHEPAVPNSGQPVTVTVAVADADGVSEVRLFYAEDRQPLQSVIMQAQEDGQFVATIPGYSTGRVVQFFVQATDGQGGVSNYPAAGAESRALYRVNDRAATDGPRHNLRIIMTQDDLSEMFTRTNFTSNQRLGATVIWQESQVYYDVEVRLKGSGFSRGSAATGVNLRFAPDQFLFGEHDVVSIDRQGGPWGIGASHREMTIKHIANRAGNIPMMYDDIINLIGPRDSMNGSAQLLAARFDDVFLDSQYADGSQGTRYKFELIYYSTLTDNGDPEGLKLAPGSMRAGVFPVVGVDMPYMGPDPEAYRWYYLIRNNRDRDDYSRIIAMTDALRASDRTPGGQLDLLTQEAMDVDQWMRLFAFESLAGINDTFNQGLQHNLQLYVRPSDQRVLAFPWDMDFALHQSTSMSIYGTGSRLSRVINISTNRRLFQQHLWDIMQTAYREDYLDSWVRHLATRSERNDTEAILSYVRARRAYVLARLAAQIPFEITTPDKDQLVVDTPHVTLEGRGWIDVRQIYLVGQETPLPVRWLDDERWEVVVPLQAGTQTIELQAFDLHGNQVGSATATITTSAASLLADALRVTELNYHPADPTAAERAAGWTDGEAFEFVEVTNVSQLEVSLAGVRFLRDLPDGSRSGIDFEFPDVALPPGQSMVVVQNPEAFAARYGDQFAPLGSYQGRLSNAGETVTLVGPGGELLQQFRFDDAWYPATDGQGATLEIRSAQTSPLESWNDATAWMASPSAGGTPGRAPLADWNHDGRLNEQDIDLLCAAIQAQDTAFDLTADDRVDQDDLIALVEQAMGTAIGDANLDGRFNSSDLVQTFQFGEYEDAIAGNSTWSDGDWNCDGDFTSADLVFALQRGGWQAL